MYPADDEDDPLEDMKKLDRFLDGEEQTTIYFELEKRDEAPDLSDELTDEEVSQALTALIWSLGDIGVYIEYVDHLTDRELYAELRDYCDEPNMVFPGNKAFGLHWSPIGSWGEEDMQIWLKYYASDQERITHSIDYPNDPMPTKEPL